MSHYGCDLSSWDHPNGAAINYQAVADFLRVASAGDTPFVIIKATEGTTYINPYFAADAAGFAAVGCRVAAYLFDHGGDDPGAETAAFRRVVGVYPAALDLEAPDGLDAAGYAAHIAAQTMLEPTELVYLNLSELATLPGAPWGHLLWLADPSHPNDPAKPCTLHQYGQGEVPGITGLVDMDRWEGTEDQFVTFFGTPTAAPAPAPPSAPPPAPEPPPAPPEPPVPPFPGYVSQGSTGAAVTAFQSRLAARGWSLAVDGIDGPITTGIIRAFQAQKGLVVDGVGGPVTWAALWTAPITIP